MPTSRCLIRIHQENFPDFNLDLCNTHSNVILSFDKVNHSYFKAYKIWRAESWPSWVGSVPLICESVPIMLGNIYEGYTRKHYSLYDGFHELAAFNFLINNILNTLWHDHINLTVLMRKQLSLWIITFQLFRADNA